MLVISLFRSLLIILFLTCIFNSYYPTLTTVDAVVASDWHAWKGIVLDLNDANFDDNLIGREVVVEFYAKWCGACTAFKPTYDKWANQVFHSTLPSRHIAIAKVDATLNPEITRSKAISAYPTLKFFRDGIHLGDYLGDRSLTDLNKWIAQLSQHDGLGSTRPEQILAISEIDTTTTTTTTTATTITDKPTTTTPTPVATPATAALTKSSDKKSETKSSGSILPPDYREWILQWVELNDLQQIREIFLGLIDAPLDLFQAHPYMVIGVVYVLALFQGLFCGIICTIARDKR